MGSEVDVRPQALLFTEKVSAGDVLRHSFSVLDSHIGPEHRQKEIRLVRMGQGQRERELFNR